MPNLLEIKYYGCDILTQKAKPVETLTSEIKELIEDMLFTMYTYEGVGLAAPQVGVSLRIFVCDYEYMKSENKNPLVCINPEIIEFDGEQTYEEGCLSFPDLFETVKRFQTIKLRYKDISFKDNLLTVSDTFAVVIQHEYDHLNGIILTDKMNPLRKMAHAFKIAKIQEKAKRMTNDIVRIIK